MSDAPRFLADYADRYATDPRAACRDWLRDAGYGLFLHYGLYSLLGRHEWVQLRETIPVAEYATLADRFTAENFDADAIAEFAVDAGMKYVNLTTRHHDGFCLFKTAHCDFQSLNSPCGRDLVAELATACDKQGLGLCLYYSHGRDWWHPHSAGNDEWGGSAHPQYDPPEPRYVVGPEHNLQHYLDFMTAQITELLTQYGPIAAIWLDGIAVPASGDRSKWRCQELYDHIHSLQPQVLVSYKQGLLHTEDFYAPEHKAVDVGDDNRILEVCTTMTPGSWGYDQSKAGQHKTVDQVWDELRKARAGRYNLLLNTGPLPDGSLDPEDELTLRAIGRRLRADHLA